MPKKTRKPAELILEILKDAGVELDDSATKTVVEAVNEQITLEAAGSVLAEGEIAVREEAWKERGKDLVTLRKRAHDAEDRVKELTDAMEAGQSPLKKENELLRTKLKEIEPLHATLLEAKRRDWDGIAAKIPENLQAHLHWPQSETEKLTDAQVIENMNRIAQWQELGVPGLPGVQADSDNDGKAPNIPKGSPAGKPPKGGGEDYSKLTPSQKMELGYKTTNKLSSGAKEG